MFSSRVAVAVSCVAGVSVGVLGVAAAAPNVNGGNSHVSVSETRTGGGAEQGKQGRVMRKVMPLLKELSVAETDEEKLAVANEIIAVMEKTKQGKGESSLTVEQKRELSAAMENVREAFSHFRALKEEYGHDPATYTDEQKAEMVDAVAAIREAVSKASTLFRELHQPHPQFPPVPRLPESWN